MGLVCSVIMCWELWLTQVYYALWLVAEDCNSCSGHKEAVVDWGRQDGFRICGLNRGRGWEAGGVVVRRLVIRFGEHHYSELSRQFHCLTHAMSSAVSNICLFVHVPMNILCHTDFGFTA